MVVFDLLPDTQPDLITHDDAAEYTAALVDSVNEEVLDLVQELTLQLSSEASALHGDALLSRIDREVGILQMASDGSAAPIAAIMPPPPAPPSTPSPTIVGNLLDVRNADKSILGAAFTPIQHAVAKAAGASIRQHSALSATARR
eukprot:4920722-Prymnesium_polylepis.1